VPARLRDLKRALEALGVVVEQPRSVYIRSVCLAFGLNEQELRSKL
jgi:hypothetical protein